MYKELALQVSIGVKESQERLSKRLQGQCEDVSNRSGLMLVGGNFDGQVLKAKQLKPVLLGAQAPVFDSIDAQLRFQRSLPKAVSALLFAGGMLPKEGYVEGIGGEDYGNLISTAVSLAKPDGEKDGVVIRTVFGATETMPLRALSYLLPSLILMERLKEEGLTIPQLQVVFANQISARLNGLDMVQATNQSEKLVRVAQSYAQTFFPEIAGSAVFLQDTPLERGSVLRNELLNNAAVLRKMAQLGLEDVLRGKAINNGAGRIHIFYGAAHPILHDADFKGSLVPIIADQSPVVQASTIISIGGYQERDFYRLRYALKPHLGPAYNQIRTLQFFTRHYVPPYYMARGGDVSLDDALNGRTVDQIAVTAQHDLNYLQRVSSFRGDFSEFLEQQRRLVA
jgi:hypothetical protein